jgi:tetratricopeptide (TPR) repeat protein
LRTRKSFKFLFVGGTIRRKGIDILLEAYTGAFTAQDDVCLVIKDMGTASFYRHQTAEAEVARLQATPGAPEIEYLDRGLSDAEMAGLYTACDCLVHPYRGEGFGLPIAEAMACGRPAIVTGLGAALDFCDDANAYLIPARVVRLPEKRIGDLETVDQPWLAEPDVAALQALLRHVVAHHDEARAKGIAASRHIHGHFTWEHSVDGIERRLLQLQKRPPRRLAKEWATVPGSVPTNGKPRVSLCMIVKNEESNLPACLITVKDLFTDMVVVDTGSTDRTRELAAQFGARVYEFPWVDSFATARNESLRHARGDWIMWLDADDRLDENNRRRLLALFHQLGDDNAAYVMKCVCLPDRAGGTATVVDHVRLFRNHPQLRWDYRVHEQILPALRRQKAEVRWSDVVIQHTGYQDAATRQRKLERDLRLLRLEEAERPDSPFTLFNLGSVYQELGQLPQALVALRRSLELSDPGDSIVRKLYALLGQCHRQLGQPAEALAACSQGRQLYPEDAELLYQESSLRYEQGALEQAEACLLRLLTTKEGDHFASIDAGLRGYRARHLLALVCCRQGRLAEAEAQWRAAVAEQPGFVPGWLELAELLPELGRWTALEEVASKLEALQQPLAAALLRARGHLECREFDRAQQLLEQVIAQAPEALSPRVILSHVLLQEGRDWRTAERALRDILTLEPNHAEARHNLAVLLERQGSASRDVGIDP